MAAAHGSVEVVLDGSSLFTLPLDGNGGASHAIGGVASGTHNLTVNYTSSDDPAQNSTATKTFVVPGGGGSTTSINITINPDPPQPNQGFDFQVFVSIN